jgi:hypothetical protein
MQLRFTSFAVINLREDLHLQECAHAGRTAVFGAQAPNRQRGAESVAPSPDTRQKETLPRKQGPQFRRKDIAPKENTAPRKKSTRSKEPHRPNENCRRIEIDSSAEFLFRWPKANTHLT